MGQISVYETLAVPVVMNYVWGWCMCFFSCYRLVGLVVKASTSRAEDPGFESHLRWDFFGVESYQ